MNTYTIGNNATMENDMVLIGNYYMERKAYNVIRNDIKENILTQNRIDARRIQKKRDEKCASDREERTYFCNQKLLGITWILIVMILTVIIGNPVCCIIHFWNWNDLYEENGHSQRLLLETRRRGTVEILTVI